jgi:hypothetical protein
MSITVAADVHDSAGLTWKISMSGRSAIHYEADSEPVNKRVKLSPGYSHDIQQGSSQRTAEPVLFSSRFAVTHGG